MANPCEHVHFQASVAVNRVTDNDGSKVLYYMADVQVSCAVCGEPFKFIGLPGGYSQQSPTVSIDAITAQLPIGPESSTMSPLDRIAQITTEGSA